MARIWRDIEIEWEDELYTVRPSMEFINHLERKEGRSISKLFQRAMAADLPSGAACELVADTISWAGGECGPEDVFEATHGGIDSTAVTLATDILLACMPQSKDPPPMSGSSKKKTARKKSTGAKRTGSQSTT